MTNNQNSKRKYRLVTKLGDDLVELYCPQHLTANGEWHPLKFNIIDGKEWAACFNEEDAREIIRTNQVLDAYMPRIIEVN